MPRSWSTTRREGGASPNRSSNIFRTTFQPQVVFQREPGLKEKLVGARATGLAGAVEPHASLTDPDQQRTGSRRQFDRAWADPGARFEHQARQAAYRDVGPNARLRRPAQRRRPARQAALSRRTGSTRGRAQGSAEAAAARALAAMWSCPPDQHKPAPKRARPPEPGPQGRDEQRRVLKRSAGLRCRPDRTRRSSRPRVECLRADSRPPPQHPPPRSHARPLGGPARNGWRRKAHPVAARHARPAGCGGARRTPRRAAFRAAPCFRSAR